MRASFKVQLHFKNKDVLRELGSFKKSSSGGISGITPWNLRMAVENEVNSSTHSSLTRVVNSLMDGKIPPPPQEVNQFICGARLIAFDKGEGDVRPIASGNVLRRLMFKFICLAKGINLPNSWGTLNLVLESVGEPR